MDRGCCAELCSCLDSRDSAKEQRKGFVFSFLFFRIRFNRCTQKKRKTSNRDAKTVSSAKSTTSSLLRILSWEYNGHARCDHTNAWQSAWIYIMRVDKWRHREKLEKDNNQHTKEGNASNRDTKTISSAQSTTSSRLRIQQSRTVWPHEWLPKSMNILCAWINEDIEKS